MLKLHAIFALFACLALCGLNARILTSMGEFRHMGAYVRAFCAFAAFSAAAIIPAAAQPTALRAAAWLPILLYGLLSACLYLVYAFFKKDGRVLGLVEMEAALQTDLPEARGFAQTYILRKEALLPALLLLLTICGSLWWGGLALRAFFSPGPGAALAGSAALLCISALFFAFTPVLRNATLIILSNRRNLKEFKKYAAAIEKADNGTASKQGRGELYVIVVGESECRDYMHAYAGPLENTPWLDSASEREGWVLFRNAYASHTQTIYCVPQAFSDGRSLTGSTFPHGHNIISTSRQAGMRTVWLSNQTDRGIYSSAVTAIAYLADRTIFSQKFASGRNLFQNTPPDEVLLPLLEQELEARRPDENTLIVVHLMGSHIPYLARLPENFRCRCWTSPRQLGALAEHSEKAEQFSHYVCSVQYTDSVMERIAGLVEKHASGPSCLLYFADHGDDVTLDGPPHDFSNFTWPMSRIPFLAWTSPAYREKYPDRSAGLADNAGRIFTNDLIYDLYLGLAGIESGGYRAEYDISSPHYSLDADNAILSGGKKVAADPRLHIAGNVGRFEGSPLMGAHMCNSLFKLKQTQRFGIRDFEVDLLYLAAEGGHGLFVGHDPEHMAGGLELDEYLSALGSDFDHLWLDIKNLEAKNSEAVFSLLYRLDKKYSLRARALVESLSAEALAIFAENGWETAFFLSTETLRRLSVPAAESYVRPYFDKAADNLRQYNLAGASYDLELDHLVRKHLLPVMPAGKHCYSWRHAWKYTDKDLRAKIRRYPHVSRLLVKLDTPFDI